jgi:glutathione S-transferase
MLTLYTTALSANGRKVLAVCRQPKLADFAVAGMVTYFPIASFPFKDHPPFMNWYARVEALDGWRATRHPLWSV